MRITQDVVVDLLPVYLSGEASRDTKALIEEFARQNPDFAGSLEAQKREFESQKELLKSSSGPLSADHEMRTLARTRALIERQKWFMGLALMLTAFPFSFVFDGGHITFMLVRDQPVLAAASWIGAAVLWINYWRAGRGLRVAGLAGR